jgi:hypothetical protein
MLQPNFPKKRFSPTLFPPFFFLLPRIPQVPQWYKEFSKRIPNMKEFFFFLKLLQFYRTILKKMTFPEIVPRAQKKKILADSESSLKITPGGSNTKGYKLRGLVREWQGEIGWGKNGGGENL